MNLLRALTGGVKLVDHPDEDIVDTATNIFQFHVEDVKHQRVALDQYKGKVCLVTNVAGL